MEKKIRRHQHRLNRKLQSLLRRLPVLLRQIGEAHQSRNLTRRDRSAIRPPGHRRYDAFHAGLTRRLIANQNMLSAFLNGLRRKRSDEVDRLQELVDLAIVGVLVRKRADEIVADEPRAEDMISL